MARVTYPDGAAIGLEIRDGFFGSLLATLDWDRVHSVIDHQNVDDYTDELNVSCASTATGASSIAHGRVFRLNFDSGQFREWRMEIPEHSRGTRGDKRRDVLALGPHRDLVHRSGIVRQLYANGQKDPNVHLLGLTPAQHISFILSNSDAAGVFEAGTLNFTTPVDVNYAYATPWAALLAVKEAIQLRAAAPAYLRIVPDPATSKLQIDFVSDPASGEDTIDIEYTKNELRITKTLLADKLASQVIVRSAGQAGEELTNADAAFEIDAKSGGQIDFLADDSPFAEDDFLNNRYVEDIDGTLVKVTDTVAASDRIVLASTPSAAVGDRLTFKDNASGEDMLVMESPQGIANIGPRLKQFQKNDIPPIDNIAPNPMFANFSGSTPVKWNYFLGATGSQDTSDQYSRYGLSSWHLSLPNKDDYVETDDILIRSTQDLRYLTAQILLWVATGSARLELRDYSDTAGFPFPKVWFPEIADVRARTGPTLDWALLGVYPGEDFYWIQNYLGLTRGTYRVAIIAEEESTDLWVDAWQIIQDPLPRETIYPRSASADLFLFGRDYLANFNNYEAVTVYDVEFLDRTRLGQITGQKVVAGTMASLTDSDLEQTIYQIPKRIIDVSRDHKRRGITRIDLEEIPAHLAERFLGRPPPPIRATIPDNTQVPPCGLLGLEATGIGGVLFAQWERLAGISRYRVVDISGLTGNPKEVFEKAPVLLEDDVTEVSWPLGSTISTIDPVTGDDIKIDPSAITDIAIDGYNRTGVPMKCYEQASVFRFQLPSPCPNLAGPDATTEFLSGQQPAGDVDVGTWLDIPLGAASGLQPAQTFSACALGSSEAVNPVSCDNGFFITSAWTTNVNLTNYHSGHMIAGAYTCHNVPQAGPGASQLNDWHYIGATHDRDNSDTHLHWGHGATSFTPVDVNTTSLSALYGTPLSPALFTRSAATSNIFGTCSNGSLTGAAAEYDEIAAMRSEFITVWVPSGYKVRLSKSASYFYPDDPGDTSAIVAEGASWEGQPTSPTALAVRMGLGYGGSGMQGPWPYGKLEILNASNVVQDTWDVPIWGGSVFEYDTGQTFPNGACAVATSPSGDICQHVEGLLSHGSAPFSVVPPGWAVLCGSYVVGGPSQGYRLVSSPLSGARAVLAYNQFSDVEWAVQAKVWYASTSASRPGVGAFSGSQDIRAAIRVDAVDSLGSVISTLCTSLGVDTSDLTQYLTTSCDNLQAPNGATALRITRMKRGISVGEVGHDQLQVNLGPGCCSPTPPVILPGLPPVGIDCLSQCGIVNTMVDNCAGGEGVWISTTWTVDPAVCDDGQYHVRLYVYEETDPTGAPGVLDIVDTILDPVPPSTGAYVVKLTTQQQWAGAPLPGVRASDAVGSSLSKTVRKLQVLVRIQHTFASGQGANCTSNIISSTASYADCP